MSATTETVRDYVVSQYQQRILILVKVINELSHKKCAIYTLSGKMTPLLNERVVGVENFSWMN